MEIVSSWYEDLSATAWQSAEATIGYLPNLLGAVLLLAVGWVVGRLVRAGTVGLGDSANRVLDRFLRSGRLTQFRLSPAVLGMIGAVAFWLVLFIFIVAATKVARLEAFSNWLDRIVAYLPTLLAGGFIILSGYLISILVRDLVSATLITVHAAQSNTVGVAAQGLTLLTAVIIGIDQVGIDVSFLITMIGIILAGILAGISLAFGLGVRAHVSNLIGAHNLQEQLHPGQVARLGKLEGEILELTPTSIILSTRDGRATVPAKIFDEEVTVVVTPDHGDG